MTQYHFQRFTNKHAGKGRNARSPYQATITGKHQLTIPQALCEQLGLKRGDTMVFSVREDGRIEVRAVRAGVEVRSGSFEPKEAASA